MDRFGFQCFLDIWGQASGQALGTLRHSSRAGQDRRGNT